MEKRHTLFITGGAGYVGTMLIRKFSARPDVEHIVCIDKEPRPELLNGLENITWIDGNTSDDSWQKIAIEKKPNIVIHTAWQIREMYGNQKTQWKWNIEGTDKIFDFAFNSLSVEKLIHYSTVSSYAAYPENELDHFFTEEEPFRESDYLYAIEKKVAEEHLKDKYIAAINTGGHIPQVSIIRPAAITGPRGRYSRIRFGLQAALSGQLKETWSHKIVSKLVSWVPVTPKWCRQFIHEDDIVDITELLAFTKTEHKYEIYNACPPGEPVLGIDMSNAVGKKVLPVPPWLIRIAFFWTWHLSKGAIPTSRGGWKSYSYPIVVDGSKLTRKYGFTYKMGSKDAFVKKEGRYMEFIK